MRKKRKVSKRAPLIKRPPVKRPEDEDEEIELEEEDLEFFSEYGKSSSGFLRNLNKTELEKPVPKKLPVPRNAQQDDSDSLGSLTDSDEDEQKGHVGRAAAAAAGGSDGEDEDGSGDESLGDLEDENLSGEDEQQSDSGSDPDSQVKAPNGTKKDTSGASKPLSASVATSRPTIPAKAPFQTAKKRPRSEIENDDEEKDFEKAPRASFKPKEGSNRLPIKLADGSVAFQKVEMENGVAKKSLAEEEEGDDSDVEESNSEGEEGSFEEDEDEQEADGDQGAATEDAATSFAQKKEELARIASGLLEDPQGRIAGLKGLHKITTSPDRRLQRLGMLTELAIYKDIIPGYRIRPRTEAEKQVKVSQEVKKLENFEDALVSSYHAYVQYLEKTAKAFCSLTRKQAADVDPNVIADLRESATVAVRCQTNLLVTVPHFNYHGEILAGIVSRMDRTDSTGIGEACCSAIVNIFENDETGDISLEAVKLISKMIKERGFRVPRRVLDTFLSLQLDAARKKDEPVERQAPEKREKQTKHNAKPHVSKFQKKMAKQQKEVERTLKEAEAEVDAEERSKQQTETLKHVFLAYFRVLRACREGKVAFWADSTIMELVLSTLDGLSRYAHMIDVDFFTDLLGSFKTLTSQAAVLLYGDESQSGESGVGTAYQRRAAILVSLRATIAAIQVLTGQGEAINIDLKDFSEALYASTLDVCFFPGGDPSEALQLLFRGLDMFLLRRKEPSLDRVAAFTKRLLTVSLQLDERGCAACLAFVRSIMVKYPKLSSMLEADDKVAGQGVYLPAVPDPDIAHGLSSTIWELAAGSSHFHPLISDPLAALAATGPNASKAAANKAATARLADASSFLKQPAYQSKGTFSPLAFSKDKWRKAKLAP